MSARLNCHDHLDAPVCSPSGTWSLGYDAGGRALVADAAGTTVWQAGAPGCLERMCRVARVRPTREHVAGAGRVWIAAAQQPRRHGLADLWGGAAQPAALWLWPVSKRRTRPSATVNRQWVRIPPQVVLE